MRRLYVLLVLIIASLFLTQCQREVSYIGAPDPGVITPEPITANIQGNVYDENGSPASGVTIKVGSATATTNASGYFRIKAASLDKSSSVVTAEKSGYFKSYRVFQATSGTNQVAIKMIKRNLAGTVSGASGGEVSLSNGSKVALQPNGVVVASSNAPYTGNVNIYAAYIDPTSADIDQIVPGSFLAVDRNNNRVVMTSYGMMAVELEGSNGEKLQIKSGSKATLTTAIPSSILASAPASIPMWSVDEQTGVWKEEGSATKSGNVYIAEVSHFSFWNCDVSQGAIKLTLTVINNSGLPIVHAHVRIKRNTTGWSSNASGFTDSLGQVSGFVPGNEPLELQVLDNCGNVIYTQNIGPFTQNTNIGVITVTTTSPSLITFKGTLLNCTGSPVTSGYALIQQGGLVRYAAVNAQGNFEVAMLYCNTSNSSYSVIGVDSIGQQQSSLQTGTIAAPITNVGNITACGTSTQQFINYTLDGVSYSFTGVAADSLTGWSSQQGTTSSWTTNLNGFNMSNNNNFAVRFAHPTLVAGTYPVNYIGVQNFSQNNTIVGTMNAVITNMPTGVGQFYEGSLSGSFTDAQSVTHTLTAQFRVRRSF